MHDALTPMMQQYQRLRKSIPSDTLLLFRLGDFYELFGEDAKDASGLLNVALTKRSGVPMCGVPYHAAQNYIGRLIKAGRRVAICDQTSEPQPGRIVSRDITQIISAGTVSEFNLLDARRANYLGAVYERDGIYGFAYADLSTGEFRLLQVADRQSLINELARVSPSELLVSEEQRDRFKDLEQAITCDSYAFLLEQASFTLCEHFKTRSLDGFGCAQMLAAIGAAGGVVYYLKHQLRRKIDHLTALHCDAPSDYVDLDAATQANLELVQGRTSSATSLLAVLDRTLTPMGARKLRGWILHPLRDLTELRQRQQFIADLIEEADLLFSIRAELKLIRDFERAAGRLSQASGNPRDLIALRNSLHEIPRLKAELKKLIERVEFGKSRSGARVLEQENPLQPGILCQRIQGEIEEVPALLDTLAAALVDDPPLGVKEGGIFRDGYDPHLDELRAASRDGKKWITELQEREIAETGIK
jgi:DNA mismatch repair protein MutS